MRTESNETNMKRAHAHGTTLLCARRRQRPKAHQKTLVLNATPAPTPIPNTPKPVTQNAGFGGAHLPPQVFKSTLRKGWKSTLRKGLDVSPSEGLDARPGKGWMVNPSDPKGPTQTRQPWRHDHQRASKSQPMGTKGTNPNQGRRKTIHCPRIFQTMHRSKNIEVRT